MAKKKKQDDMKKAGHYSFIAGIVLAVLIAFIPQLRGEIAIWILVILGVVVGLMNVTGEETTKFLVAVLALMIASSVSYQSLLTIWIGLATILGNIIVFVSPAAIVVALKTVVALAQD
ncbi:MAG: hypothetical protein V3V78_02205 [Candidatus Woesearchaeota archaeon]